MSEWDVVKEKIKESKIFRFPYKGLYGQSLSSLIIKYKLEGYSAKGCYQMIMWDKRTKIFLEYLKSKDLKEIFPKNVWVNVCARYSEEKTYERMKYDKNSLPKV